MDYKPAIREIVAGLAARVHTTLPGDDVELFTYFPSWQTTSGAPVMNTHNDIFDSWTLPDESFFPLALLLHQALEQKFDLNLAAEDMQMDNFRSINAIDELVRRKLG